MITLGSHLGGATEVELDPEDEPVLLGLLTRAEMEAALPDWVIAGVESTPDVDAAGAMVAALDSAEVKVFLGTWCSDSGGELSRLWRAFDELGMPSPAEIRYVGVSRDMTEPQEWVSGGDLQRVPTFVVYRGGVEVGRIVESSPNGIEKDLLSLVRGDRSGLITGALDLESDGGDH